MEGAEDCLVKNLCEFLRDVLFVDMADHPVEPREFTAFQELPLMSSRSLALAVELARTERGLEYVMSRIVVPRLLYLPPECNTDAMGTTVSATMLTGRKLAVALFKTLLAQCSVRSANHIATTSTVRSRKIPPTIVVSTCAHWQSTRCGPACTPSMTRRRSGSAWWSRFWTYWHVSARLTCT